MTRSQLIFDNLLVALIYVVSARIGQLFAIEPGNVTSVWIPSGLMIALVLHKGKHVWPGVFLGAFVGNIWAYFNTETISAALSAIAAATFNGIGDVICCVLMAHLIVLKTNTHYPFTTIYQFFIYSMFAVLAGPLVSAILGPGALFAFGFISEGKLFEIFVTWFIGDATGAMIFGPLLLSWLNPEPFKTHYQKTKLLALSTFSILVTATIFDLLTVPRAVYILSVLLFPVALFTIMYNGQRTVFTIQTLVAATAVYATSNQLGPFVSFSGNQSLIQLQLFIAAFSMVMFTIAIIVFKQHKSSEELELKKEELENLYRLDQLTNTWNRYRITEFIELELSRFQRNNRPFGVIMLDIDNFKSINDHYGHSDGDKILVEMSDLIRVHIREADLFGRWGGEEFIIVATDSNTESLKVLAEKIRTIIDQHNFRLSIKVSISLGITLSRAKDEIMNLIDRADEALYQCKKQGKNRVCLSESDCQSLNT